MRSGAKPLLVLLTDATCSLKQTRLDSVIARLHAADTKVITIDLGEENKVASTFGFVNHDEHLKFLAYVTCGAHFDFVGLMQLASKSAFGKTSNRFGDKGSQNRLNALAGIRAGNLLSGLKLTHGRSVEPTDLSESDPFHANLNSLQKLMFARPCNYSAFL